MILPILFKDQDLVVVNKPSGLLVHRSALDRQATEFALQIVRDQIGQHVYPVHRLDRPTSGALIFALSPAMAEKMGQLFQSGLVHKAYLALVRGTAPLACEVDYPLQEEQDAIADRMADPNKPARPAVTRIRRLGVVEIEAAVDRYPTSRYSLVEAIPLTGRKHQIRRHLRHLGHPVIGDVNHGVGKHNRFFRERFQIQRLLLACHALAFAHPRRGDQISIRAPLAEDFFRLLRAMGLDQNAI